MKLRIVFLLLSSVLFKQKSVANRGDKYVYDIRSNTKLEYVNIYKNIKNSKLNFTEEIDFYYPKIIAYKDSNIQNKINNRIDELVNRDIEKSPLWTSIQMHHDGILKMYTQNNKDFRDDYGYYRNNEVKFSVVIDKVNAEIKSIYNNMIVFELSYAYHSQYESQTISDNFAYNEYRYFDMSNGKEYNSNDIFSNASLPSLNALIEKKIKAYFELLPKLNRNDFSDDDDDEDDDDSYSYGSRNGSNFYDNLKRKTVEKEQKLIKFNANNDANWQFLAFSISMQIDEWSPCLENFYGAEIRLRFTFDELKPFVNPKGPFASILTAQNYPSINIKNTNQIKSLSVNLEHTDYFHPEYIEGLELIKVHIDKPVKTISIIQEEKLSSDSIRLTKNRELHYNTSGYLEFVQFFNYNKLGKRGNFTYDGNNNLIKMVVIQGAEILESNEYTYDDNNNLISEKIYDNEAGISEIHYVYFDSFCFIEKFNVNNASFKLKRVKYKEDLKIETLDILGYNYETIYMYGKNKQLLYSNSIGEPTSKGQFYAYDKININQILSHTYDENRYQKIFSYNDKGLFCRLESYDGPKLLSDRRIEYNSIDMPVKVIQFHESYKYQYTQRLEYILY